MQPLFESVKSAAAIHHPHADFDLMAPIDDRFPAVAGMFREVLRLTVRRKVRLLAGNACGRGEIVHHSHMPATIRLGGRRNNRNSRSTAATTGA